MITGTRTCAEKDTDIIIFFHPKLLYCRVCHQMSRIMKSGASWIPIELINYLLFYVSLKNLSLIWRKHIRGCGERNSNPDSRRYPFSRLLQHTKRCGKSILTRSLTGIPFGRVNSRTDFKVVPFNHPCNYGSSSGGLQASSARHLIAW
jgi:hypothetical protein